MFLTQEEMTVSSNENNEYKNLLQVESSFYEENRDELLLKYPNRVLLIHGKKVHGDFESSNEAISAGILKFGQEPFLVRRTGESEPVLSAPALTLGILQCQS
ncbi:MAG: hypothetical protein F4227_06850 [Gammaproteobacteria bacterium]|nr:hypothetical protein [Gammaproteobacteria bacterium]